MDDTLQQKLDPILKRAFFGDKNSQQELMAIAEQLMSDGELLSAALVFKETAIVYRVSAFRAEGRLEEASASNAIIKSDSLFWQQCAIELRKNSTAKSAICPELTTQTIWEILIGEIDYNGGLSVALDYYERTLKDLGVPLRQGASPIRYMLASLNCYFQIQEPDESLFMNDIRVQACIEQFATAVVSAFNSRA